MKVLAILVILFLGLFMVPMMFGIIGGIFGLIGGIIGAIFGIIGEIIGSIFGLFSFGCWDGPFHGNGLTIAAIIILVVLATKTRSKNRS